MSYAKQGLDGYYEKNEEYPYVGRGLDTYYEKHQEYPKDITLMKKIIKDDIIKIEISFIEKCVADKSRIISDTTTKIYRERKYDTCCFYPDGKGGLESRDEAIWFRDGDYLYQDGGVLADVELIEYIYYNSTIPYIYHLKYLEFIKAYSSDYPLSFLKLIYPAKMPTKDYFPFIEFKLGTEIPLILTEREEKEELLFSKIIVDEDEWNRCIVWIDKDRMFVSLINETYYFKQVGKNVHLFELLYHNT